MSAEIYDLKILSKNIENGEDNATRFLVMGNEVLQPDFGKKKYITSFLFKLKSKPAALYQSLGGFAINGVNLTKLQSYPCLLYTSPSPRDRTRSRMPSSA